MNFFLEIYHSEFVFQNYQDSLLDLDTVAYNPKDAVSIS
jgi:hypothetical protein